MSAFDASSKVLFMDIDGVLNSRRTCSAFGSYPTTLDSGSFDQAAIGLVRRLCERGAVIVLSSAWRLHYPFAEVAAAFDLPILDATPTLLGPRGLEINAWLSAHAEVKTWAIVDDNADMLPEQLPRFVQTSEEDGLRWRDYARLLELLGLGSVYVKARDREWQAPGRPLNWEAA